MNYKINKKGFTLMELLVTVILVAVLATYAVYHYNSVMDEGRVKAAKGKLAALGGAAARFVLENGDLSLDNQVKITQSNLTNAVICDLMSAQNSDTDKVMSIFRCGYAEKSLGLDKFFDFYFYKNPCGSDISATRVFIKPKPENIGNSNFPSCAYFDPNTDKVIEEP